MVWQKIWPDYVNCMEYRLAKACSKKLTARCTHNSWEVLLRGKRRNRLQQPICALEYR